MGTLTFEDLLKEAGEIGRWQIRLYLLIGLNGFFMAFQHLSSMFIAATPDHWCVIPYIPETLNWTMELTKEVTIPTEMRHGKMVHSQCTYYDRRDIFQGYSSNSTETRNLSIVDPKTKVFECNEWHYNRSQYSSTIVTDWNLVCEWKALQSTVQASYMGGVLIGCIVFGFFADKWGRRRAVLTAQVIFFIASVAVSFSSHYAVFIILRFFVAIAAPGMFACSFVLVTEIIGPQWRCLLGVCYQIPFGIGYALLPAMAYWIRDWSHLQLALSVPSVCLFSFFWFFPESPRWLITQGRFKEALSILHQCASANGKVLRSDEELLTAMRVIKKKVDTETLEASTTRKMLITGLFRNVTMAKRTSCAYFTWFVVAFVYYGLALNSPTLGGDPYVVVFLSGILEMPAYLIGFFIAHYFGRRLSYSITFFIAGVLCLAILPVPEDITWLAAALAVFGKFVITMTFGISYLYTAELFPTEIRSIAVSYGSMCARFGSISAPYIVYLLGYYHRVIPLVVFGTLGIMAGILSLFLPETKSANLAETLNDVKLDNASPPNEENETIVKIPLKNTGTSSSQDMQSEKF